MRLLLRLGLSLCLFPALTRAADPAPGVQVEQVLAVSDGGTIPFLLYLPPDYTPAGPPVPLLLFLHGSGERHGPLAIVAKWGPPRRLAAGDRLPYVVASPQCPPESDWSDPAQQRRLLELIAHLRQVHAIDGDRLYLTGLSMGGFGAWRLAAAHPQLFAAVAPVCGGGDPADAPRLTMLPVWAWHGTEDAAVPFARSVEMVEAIRAAGGTRVRFTSLEHIGHFSWQAAYQSQDLYEWFDAQRASRNR